MEYTENENKAAGAPSALSVDTWGEFLNARAKVIDWLAQEHNNTEIAQILSMTPTQVMDIYSRDRLLDVVFNCGSTEEIMRMDKDGMTYKGQRIEDGGEAHKAFLEVMEMMEKVELLRDRPSSPPG